MCGIAGIFSFNSSIDITRVIKMTDIISHRGPDGKGLWSSVDGMVCLGHRRLSIIDLTENGAQPMHYAKRYTITYNGEIYNYQALKKELIEKGFSFQSNSDTEVLLALFQCYGTKCLEKMDGMFAFAIWDRLEETLFCARDRFGEKPFFYHKGESEFLFGSEIKTLFVAGVEKSINQKRLINYLACNEIEDITDKSSTFYSNINSLEASHYLLVKKNGELTKTKYYDLKFEERTISFDEAREEFKMLMGESVALRKITSEVNVGTSLSGGVDSSIIFHELNQIHHNPHSFTASFPGFVKDETSLVKLMHQNYSAEASFVSPTSDDYINSLDSFFFHQDEPVRNANLFAQWTVYQLAKKENTTVLLDGQGADEVFAGYHLYFKPFLQSLFRRQPLQFKKQYKDYQHSQHLQFDKHFYSQALFPKTYHKYTKFRNYYKGNITDLNDSFLNENEHFLSQHPYISPNLNKVQHFNIFNSGLEQLLRYGDRSSMAHSIEVRLPFLSRKIVEFASQLPTNYKIDKGYSKYICRAAYDNLIPDEIIWKKDKIGYEAPQKSWFDNVLVQEKINDSISKLVQEKIISKNTDKSKWWQYIQVAKLIEQ